MPPVTTHATILSPQFFTAPPAKLPLLPPSTTTTIAPLTTAVVNATLNYPQPATNQPKLSDFISLEWDERPSDRTNRNEAFYDVHIQFFGLFYFRIWMLLAAGAMLVTTMIIITCCIIRLRIPRSRREIEILAARRRERMNRARRKKEKEKAAINDERSPAIVMNAAVQRLPSMKRPNRTDSKNEKDRKVVKKKDKS